MKEVCLTREPIYLTDKMRCCRKQKKGKNFKKQRMTNGVRCNRVVMKLIHRPGVFDSSGHTTATETLIRMP